MNRADKVLLWIKLVLSLVQLVAALALIGLLLEPQLADGIDRLETAIHGRQITLESTFKIKTTVKGSYRVEIVPPRQNQKE